MIVVDTNVIAYLLLPTPHTDAAERLLQQDPEWCAPFLWRSELRSVLFLYVRKGLVDTARAIRIQGEAESLLEGREYEVSSSDILELASTSPCSAYDSEFIALARALKVPLVTSDRKVIDAFPDLARALTEFAGLRD